MKTYGELFANGADGVLFKDGDIITKVSHSTTYIPNEGFEVDHPNIVKVIESRVEDGKLIEVMPFYEHGCLREVEHIFKDEENVLALIDQISSAIDYLHQNNIQHRDIKPENVLVESIDPPIFRLADFGRAKEGANTLSATNTVGTLKYMATEAIVGMPNKRSDYYSFGAMIGAIVSNNEIFNIKNIIDRTIDYSKIPYRFRKLVINLTKEKDTKRWSRKEIEKFLTGGVSLKIQKFNFTTLKWSRFTSSVFLTPMMIITGLSSISILLFSTSMVVIIAAWAIAFVILMAANVANSTFKDNKKARGEQKRSDRAASSEPILYSDLSIGQRLGIEHTISWDQAKRQLQSDRSDFKWVQLEDLEKEMARRDTPSYQKWELQKGLREEKRDLSTLRENSTLSGYTLSVDEYDLRQSDLRWEVERRQARELKKIPKSWERRYELDENGKRKLIPFPLDESTDEQLQGQDNS